MLNEKENVMINTTKTIPVILPGAPSVPGLNFRVFMGEQDYPNIASVIAGSKVADKIERADSLEFIAHYYSHLVNCDPYKDMLFAQIDERVVGYTRVAWWTQANATRIYRCICFLLPEWRQRGIGTAFLNWDEQRLRQIAETHPNGQVRYFESSAADSEVATQALLEKHGYAPVRYNYLMVRRDLENIPQAPLPSGLEVRPVKMEHIQAIRAASIEAFRDHWGFSEETEPGLQAMIDDPNFDPSLWQVAWDGDQVAGMVLAFIDKKENEEYHRKRGWTENICVRRPWRKRGLARALIVRSFYAIKERGMQEAALGVDTQNESGALQLYESVGFRPVKRLTLYRKPME
jgi:GNAT superfamily N-acetyltransferase